MTQHILAATIHTPTFAASTLVTFLFGVVVGMLLHGKFGR